MNRSGWKICCRLNLIMSKTCYCLKEWRVLVSICWFIRSTRVRPVSYLVVDADWQNSTLRISKDIVSVNSSKRADLCILLSWFSMHTCSPSHLNYAWNSADHKGLHGYQRPERFDFQLDFPEIVLRPTLSLYIAWVILFLVYRRPSHMTGIRNCTWHKVDL